MDASFFPVPALATLVAQEIISSPKKLLNVFGPPSDDKEHMKYFAKTVFAIVQTLNGLHVPLQRKHFAAFAEKCVPPVLVEMIEKRAIVSVLYRMVADFFVPLQPLLLDCTVSDVVEVEDDLFNCFTTESVTEGYRCNGTGTMVFTIEEALQWFLTRGLKAPDGTIVTSLQRVRKAGNQKKFPVLPLNLYMVLQPLFIAELRADLFYCKPTYNLEHSLDYRYEYLQDWNDAEDDSEFRYSIITELNSFAHAWELNIPSLSMMKSIFLYMQQQVLLQQQVEDNHEEVGVNGMIIDSTGPNYNEVQEVQVDVA